MIFTCNASRLAIYISWGHRNNNFFFSKNHKTNDFFDTFSPLDKSLQTVIKKNLSLYRQKVPNNCLAGFLDHPCLRLKHLTSQNSIN